MPELGSRGNAALVISGALAIACGLIVVRWNQSAPACVPTPAVAEVQKPAKHGVMLTPEQENMIVVKLLEGHEVAVSEPPLAVKVVPLPFTPVIVPPWPPPSEAKDTEEPDIREDAPPARATTPPSAAAKPGIGFVRIRTDPWGFASVPGQRVDTMSGKLTLPTGKHAIYIECSDCVPKKSKVISVIVKADMTQNISIHWDEED